MTADGSDRSFGAPRFDVVLRGYDRRQVDDHLSRLQRVLSRMRSDLEAARGRPPMPPPPPGGLPRPSPRRRPDGEPGQDVVGTFTDRMQTILQSAEEEAAEIRSKARSAVKAEEERLAGLRASSRTEEETVRSQLTHLVRQRDAVLADLTRVRGQLEALLAGPTARITVPSQDTGGPAAARRDAGAGHPLPGTPSGPPPRRPGPRGPAPDATAAVPAKGGAERTQVMKPVDRPPDAPADRTVAVRRPSEEEPKPDAAQPGAAPDADAGEPAADGPAGDDQPTRVQAAPASRSS